MDRRSGDAVQRMIDEWEARRRAVGSHAPHAVADYIDAQIAHLRFEKAARDRPMSDGRRATDPKPNLSMPPFHQFETLPVIK